MLRYLSIILVILIFNTKSSAENLEVFKFTKDEFNELEVRKIRGAESKTTYSLDTNKNGN